MGYMLTLLWLIETSAVLNLSCFLKMLNTYLSYKIDTVECSSIYKWDIFKINQHKAKHCV